MDRNTNLLAGKTAPTAIKTHNYNIIIHAIFSLNVDIWRLCPGGCHFCWWNSSWKNADGLAWTCFCVLCQIYVPWLLPKMGKWLNCLRDFTKCFTLHIIFIIIIKTSVRNARAHNFGNTSACAGGPQQDITDSLITSLADYYKMSSSLFCQYVIFRMSLRANLIIGWNHCLAPATFIVMLFQH